MAQQMLTVMAAEAAAAHSSSPDQTLPQPQHATPRIKVKGRRRAKSRTSYSLSLKLKAVEEAERSGLRAAAVNLQLDERVLRQWLTKAEDLRQAGLTNSGSTRRLRSRSASASKLANSVASSPEDIEVPDPSPPALASGSSIDRNVALLAVTPPSAGLLANIVHNPLSVSSPSADGSPCSHSTSCSSSLVVSRADACVGTCSASIMTEPEFLGPCEPGTAVTLEGIVWHETEGGVLVVNVTWRGKTYVGTLMDSTKNEWAPPRFCDSPTSDAESRAPKGRAKRGRGASSTPVPTGGGSGGGLSSLVDTSMSPMHSKLRNGAKGRRSVGGGSGGGLPAPPSPAKEAMASGGKRKGNSNSGIGGKNNADDGSASKRSRSSSRGAGSSSPSIEPPAATTSTASPMLIECPEPNCSKKYRHINGLKYHQSHAHGGVSSAGANGSGPAEANFDEDSSQDVPLVILKKDYPPTLTDEAVEVAPFTGKVPMPPPPELAPKPSSPRTPLPSLVFLSASSPSVIPTDASPSSKPDHLFSPIVTQPNTASTETAAATSWPTLSPSPVTPKAAEGATDPADRKERSKHKKKSKGKDRDRADKKDRSTSKKTPGTPAAATANGALNPSSPVVDSTPASANDGPATTTSSSLPTVSSAIVSATTDGLLPTPAADPTREDVQSPAYSDISDANDQSPSLLDTELIGSKKVGDNLAAEASACFSPVATGPGLGPFSMYPFYEQQPYMTATTDDQAGAKLSMNPEERNDKAPQTSVPGQQPQPPPGAPPGMYQLPSGMPIKDAVKGELMKSDSKMPPLLPIDSGAQPGITGADLPGGAPSQVPAGPSSGAFDPALLYQQQQHQEDLRQFYNVYGGDDPMMWSGGPPPMSMFLPPMSSPGSGPHHDAAQQQQIMQHMQQQQIAQQQQFTQQYQQQQFAQQYQQQMQQQSLQFDPSQSVYRNTMESMLGGSPHSFGPSPGAGPFGMQHHPHQSSPGMRGYPSGPGFPGPTGEGPSRAHALEMLQRQANQYYATLAGPPAPPSAQGAGGVGAPPNGGGPGTPSPSFKSQQHKTPPPSPAVGHEKMSMGSGMVPPNASTIPTSSKVGSNMPMNRQVNSSMGPPPPPSAGLLPPSSHHQYPPSGSPYGGPKPLLRP